MEFIIVSLLLISSFGWVVKIQNECSCSDYKLQSECIQSIGCFWNRSQNFCADVTCSLIKSPVECLQYPTHCSYDLSQLHCVPFTSCANLKGENNSQCSMQNQMCQWVSGNQCVDYNCQNFNLSSCPQFCINTGTTCENFSSCEKLNQTYCQLYSSTCLWKENKCQHHECSDYKTSSSCLFVLNSEDTITPCSWNQTQCINAEDQSIFTSNQCFSQTAGQYHWSSNNSTTGSCQQCQISQNYSQPMTEFLSKGVLLSIAMMGVIMII